MREGEGQGLIWRLFGMTRYAERDGPAYRNYARLGFKLAYFRSHYSYLPANSG